MIWGQWAVGSGQWAVGSGQWAVGSGHWCCAAHLSSHRVTMHTINVLDRLGQVVEAILVKEVKVTETTTMPSAARRRSGTHARRVSTAQVQREGARESPTKCANVRARVGAGLRAYSQGAFVVHALVPVFRMLELRASCLLRTTNQLLCPPTDCVAAEGWPRVESIAAVRRANGQNIVRGLGGAGQAALSAKQQ